jgi:cytochrome c oxidase subunit 4
MSDHSHADIAKHIKIYIFVFVALLIGTIITVWLNSIHFDSKGVTIGIALLVAFVKAALVACYFMHLISEKKMIYVILAFTAFFFIGMMFLTLWTYADPPPTTTHL